MITEPRLSLFETRGLGARAKRAAIEAAFGFYPGAIHVMEPKTQLDRSSYMRSLRSFHRPSSAWDRPTVELIASFTSARNHCVF